MIVGRAKSIERTVKVRRKQRMKEIKQRRLRMITSQGAIEDNIATAILKTKTIV